MSGGVMTGLFSGLFGSIANFFSSWLGAKRQEKNLKEQGRVTEQRDNAAKGQQEVTKAVEARNDMDRAIGADPDKLREPDEFTRTD